MQQVYNPYTSKVSDTFIYTTFGSVMLERVWVDESRNYRFGFNGMERDDEMKGGGNSYDFGARIYDSRLGRWMSLDPLMVKYPSLSDYCFVANNPNIFVDVKGRDYKIVIDKGAKTITIVATYYVNDEETHRLTQQAVNEIMETSGKFSLKVDGEKYKINFELNVEQVENKLVNHVASGDDAGNSVEILPNQEFDNRTSGTSTSSENSDGTVLYGQNVIIAEGNLETDEQKVHIIKHEILHTLGVDHPNGKRSAKINKRAIRAMLHYPSVAPKSANKLKGNKKNQITVKRGNTEHTMGNVRDENAPRLPNEGYAPYHTPNVEIENEGSDESVEIDGKVKRS